MFRVHLPTLERELPCERDETILAAALRAGLHLPFGCRTGGCGTCKMRLVDGEIEGPGSFVALTPEEREAGWFLPCVTRPSADCVVETGATSAEEHRLLATDRARVFTGELVRNERVAQDIHALRLRLIDPSEIRFTAGQFVNVEVPGENDVRSYSIGSTSFETKEIELYVKRRPHGRFSGLLDGGLRLGAQLRFFGPFGQLRVRLSHRPIIMIARGSGLAPILSMLGDLAEKRSPRKVRLFLSARAKGELFALDRLAEIGRLLPNFALIPVILPSDATASVLSDVLARHVGAAPDIDAYVGGSPWWIQVALAALLGCGVRRRNIYFDVFTPAVQ